MSDFESAWQLATAHRVDLNLLVDYGWPRFLQTAADFVRQVPDDQDLMDLLSALRGDSVLAEGGLYAGLPPADMPGPEVDCAPPAPPDYPQACLVVAASCVCCLMPCREEGPRQREIALLVSGYAGP